MLCTGTMLEDWVWAERVTIRRQGASNTNTRAAQELTSLIGCIMFGCGKRVSALWEDAPIGRLRVPAEEEEKVYKLL